MVASAAVWVGLSCGSLHAQSIRSRVVLVPIDVRVLDDRGEPVKDLARADLRIYERRRAGDRAGRLAFAQERGQYRATIFAAVTVEGTNGEALGDLLRKIDVAIPERVFARTRPRMDRY